MKPKHARTLDDLSPAMARALVRYATAPIPLDQLGASPAGDRWIPIQAVTRDALVENDLLGVRCMEGIDVWAPTEHGMEIVCAHQPMLLAARSQFGYTAEPSQALFGEPEAVDTAELAHGWRHDARVRYAEACGSSAEARRLAQKLRAA